MPYVFQWRRRSSMGIYPRPLSKPDACTFLQCFGFQWTEQFQKHGNQWQPYGNDNLQMCSCLVIVRYIKKWIGFPNVQGKCCVLHRQGNVIVSPICVLHLWLTYRSWCLPISHLWIFQMALQLSQLHFLLMLYHRNIICSFLNKVILLRPVSLTNG